MEMSRLVQEKQGHVQRSLPGDGAEEVPRLVEIDRPLVELIVQERMSVSGHVEDAWGQRGSQITILPEPCLELREPLRPGPLMNAQARVSCSSNSAKAVVLARSSTNSCSRSAGDSGRAWATDARCPRNLNAG